jgi:hypothetical protein
MKHRAGATHVAFTTQRDSLLADAVQAARTGPAIAAPLLQRMTQEIFKYHREVVPDGQNRAQRERSRLALELICRELWPNAVIHVFGSVASTLYLRDSDIDFTVALPEADMQVLRNTAEPAAPPSRRRNRKSATAAAATTTGGDTPAAPAVASSSSSTTSSALSKAAELHDVSWVPPDSETHNLFVTNLPFTASADDVLSIFEPCGAGGVFLPMRAGTTQMKGLGFLLMPTKQSASDAISAMNGVVLGGRPLRVSLAKYGFSTELAQPGFLDARAQHHLLRREVCSRAAAAAAAAAACKERCCCHYRQPTRSTATTMPTRTTTTTTTTRTTLPEEEWTAEDARRRGGDVLALTEAVPAAAQATATLGQFKLIDMARIPIIQRHVRGPSTSGRVAVRPDDQPPARRVQQRADSPLCAGRRALRAARAARQGVGGPPRRQQLAARLPVVVRALSHADFLSADARAAVLPNLCAGRATGSSVLIDGYNCYFDREAQPPSQEHADARRAADRLLPLLRDRV